METSSDEKKLELGPQTLRNLNSIRKWTMFLSVLGFILLGLFIVFAVATTTFLNTFKSEEAVLGLPESLMLTLFIVLAAIYFFPVFFLFRFSRNARDAVQTRDQKMLEKAFRNLRSYYTYIGIMVIIILAVYLVAFVAAGASVSFLKGM